MKTALLLLLLGGFLCGLHGAEDQDPDLLFMITKLLTRVQTLEMKDQSHQSEVQSLQSEVQSLKTQIQDLETKDQSLKTQIQTLEAKNQSHLSQVQSLQSEVQSLKTQIQDLETKDQSLKTQIQDLETKDQSHQSQVQSLKTQIQTLEISQAQPQTNPRVAFYAGFNTGTQEGDHGPFDAVTTIKYKNVRTNVGGGYSADTGVFTAPLRGTYVFSFVMHTKNDTFASLRRNSEILAYGYDKSVSNKWDSSTGVAVVTLEAGDTVYVVLEPPGRFYGFRGLFNSFSGFLLFPM